MTRKLQATLSIEVYDTHVATHLDSNPGRLSYAELSRELLAASKHLATLPEGILFPDDDPDIAHIPIEMNDTREGQDGQL